MSPVSSDTSAPHILLIDDDPIIHGLVGGILKSLGLTVVSALNGDDGIERARAGDVQLILLDNNLADAASGLDVLKRLKAAADLQGIPVIMVTGEARDSVLTECFAAGAIDYVRKPFAATELRARVHSVLERQRMLGELTRAARCDRLTGLANRATLSDRLSIALDRARGDTSYGFAVMFLDFDRFKFVNDTLGHDVGDLLLQAISGRLLHNLRATEGSERGQGSTTIARLGGDEFVVVLAGVTTEVDAERVGSRLLQALGKPYQLAGHTVLSTASIGTVLSSPTYESIGEILRDADTAMYEAKSRGKARQVVFTTDMRDAVHESAEIETSLRAAIGTPQLHVEYQPIFSLDSQSVWAIEAFARWTHPVRGTIVPNVFIPLAEQMGLITALSDQVLHSACATFMGLTTVPRHSSRGSPEFVSVNLSHLQLSDPLLVHRTLELLQSCGMRPDQLQIEISESIMVRHRLIAVAVVNALRASGIRVAMDNFGARESSLSCLQDFSVVSLKIDRSVVANSARGREFAALLHAVITLAENLGFAVVAEGVETHDELVLLQALGCGFAQGFLLAPPMSAEALQQFFLSDASVPFTSELAAV